MYSPYEPQATGSSSLARDIAFSAINPANYYLYNPGAWDTTRGLKVPIGGAISKQRLQRAWATVDKAGNSVSLTQRAKNIFGVITHKPFTPMYLGRGILAQYAPVLNAKNELQDVAMAAFKNKKLAKSFVSQAMSHSIQVGSANVTDASLKLSIQLPKGVAFSRRTGSDAADILKRMPTNARSILTKGAIARGLLSAGRAVSFIGLADIAWSVSKAVAEPLGRLMVNASDAFLNDWSNRFLPEMGGGLQPGFLTMGAATERQRALQAISKAHINGRSALGQEAQLYHR